MSKPKLNIVGTDGNAFSLLEKARRVARYNNIDFESILKELTSGDYDHLLTTLSKYFEVS